MRKKNTFEKKFPEFVKYIRETEVQINMLDNADLIRKYNAYNEQITAFLQELAKWFSIDDVKNFIIEVIVKLPDELLNSLIKAYLNSSDAAKQNKDFLAYYNKTCNLGKEAVLYIEEYGLITSRNYKDIPLLAVDKKYELLKDDKYVFRETMLDDIYNSLTLAQRRYVISVIESGVLASFDEIFGTLKFNYMGLINLLMVLGIDVTILNREVLTFLGAREIMILVCLLIDNNGPMDVVLKIKAMLADKRFNLVITIINENLIVPLANLDSNEWQLVEDEQALDILRKKNLVLSKCEN